MAASPPSMTPRLFPSVCTVHELLASWCLLSDSLGGRLAFMPRLSPHVRLARQPTSTGLVLPFMWHSSGMHTTGALIPRRGRDVVSPRVCADHAHPVRLLHDRLLLQPGGRDGAHLCLRAAAQWGPGPEHHPAGCPPDGGGQLHCGVVPAGLPPAARQDWHQEHLPHRPDQQLLRRAAHRAALGRRAPEAGRVHGATHAAPVTGTCAWLESSKLGMLGGLTSSGNGMNDERLRMRPEGSCLKAPLTIVDVTVRDGCLSAMG